MVAYNEARVASLAAALREIPSLAIDVIESDDPQYRAVASLVRLYGEKASVLVVANALISYRLSMPGEEYWQEFAEYFQRRGAPASVEELLGSFRDFLSASKGNRVLRDQKLSRLRRASRVLQALMEEPERYRDLRRLVEDLRLALGGRGDEKTLVFAAKMLHYVHRALGVEEKGLNEVPVPIDRRMALLTSTSGLLDAAPEEIMSRLRGAAVEAWMNVSRLAGIPSVSLDAVVWLPAYRIERIVLRDLERARDEYARRLVSYTRGIVKWATARRIAEEVLHRRPLARRSYKQA